MNYTPRVFQSEKEIREIGEGILDKSLPKVLWTHEAHFASVVYFLTHRPELNLEEDLPRIIAEYNESQGNENTDHSGYHETLTQFYIQMIRCFVNKLETALSIKEVCNLLVQSKYATRDYPLTFYSKDRLFSKEARKAFVEPDLMPLVF